MKNNNENKILNVPNLRFPEFSEEWKKMKVSELLDFYSTNSLSWEQLDYNNGNIEKLPYIITDEADTISIIGQESEELSKTDWDSFETSWDFKKHPLV